MDNYYYLFTIIISIFGYKKGLSQLCDNPLKFSMLALILIPQPSPQEKQI